MPLTILFPAFSDALREPDPEFHRELRALEELGIPWRVVNITSLTTGDLPCALRFFGKPPDTPLLYRGWILHPREYEALESALHSLGCRLHTPPEAYRRALLFPEFFPAIASHSFPAVWIEGKNPREALAAAKRLGPPPYFIKDYAKSAKEIWPAGCVVLHETEMPAAIRALAEYRADRFEGGIVIRPLLRLCYLGESPFGGPLYEEYRLFFFHGNLLSASAYDRLGGNPLALPDYSFLPSRIDSPFFSADVIVTETGEAYLLETGDGGSSALPPGADPLTFYRAILENFPAK